LWKGGKKVEMSRDRGKGGEGVDVSSNFSVRGEVLHATVASKRISS